MTNIADECGMSINKAKCSIMMFNYKEKILKDNIEGIQITGKINYMGVSIQDKRNCFKKQKIEQINKAKRCVNLMPAVIP